MKYIIICFAMFLIGCGGSNSSSDDTIKKPIPPKTKEIKTPPMPELS
jgi:hypothetical protein